jgi:hypothetical protein
MGQFLTGAKREGKPFWHMFWVGGTLDQYNIAGPAESPATEHWRRRSTAARLVAALDLNNVPWTLLISAVLGIWLMAAPAVLGVTGTAADSNHLAGALVVTWAVIAFGEVARPVRLLNLPTGLWIAISPWMLSGATGTSQWLDVFVELLLVALSVRCGHIEERFGGWNRFLI